MWKKYLKITFFFLLFFLVFGLGFFLPERLFAMSDAKKMETVAVSEEQTLKLPGAEQISMEKKLQYLYQAGDTSEMQIVAAEAKDEDWLQIDEVIQRELQNLQKYHLLPESSALLLQSQKKKTEKIEESMAYDVYYKRQKKGVTKYFIVDSSGDGEFVALWLVYMESPKMEQLYFWLDDESGKILSLGFQENKVRKNREKAKKRFQKYLRAELSIALEEMPDFPLLADDVSYSICPESLGAIPEELGFYSIVSSANL